MILKNRISLKNILFLVVVAIISLIFTRNLYGEKETTTQMSPMHPQPIQIGPYKGIAAKTKISPMCKIDLNGDKTDDFVFLVYKWKVFVLLTKDKKYNLQWVDNMSRLSEWGFLSCHKGKYVTETTAGPGKRTVGRKVKIPEGFYFIIGQPEGAAAAYYWKDGTFKVVWIAD